MGDWFFDQYDSKPSTSDAEPPVPSTSRQRTVTLSVRNHTYLAWTVAVHGSKTTDARAAALLFRPLEVPPNDSSSGTVVRLIQNEKLHVSRMEAASALSSRATLTLVDEERRELAWGDLPEHTDVSLCIQWGPSDHLTGHAVPTLQVETIRLQS